MIPGRGHIAGNKHSLPFKWSQGAKLIYLLRSKLPLFYEWGTRGWERPCVFLRVTKLARGRQSQTLESHMSDYKPRFHYSTMGTKEMPKCQELWVADRSLNLTRYTLISPEYAEDSVKCVRHRTRDWDGCRCHYTKFLVHTALPFLNRQDSIWVLLILTSLAILGAGGEYLFGFHFLR